MRDDYACFQWNARVKKAHARDVLVLFARTAKGGSTQVSECRFSDRFTLGYRVCRAILMRLADSIFRHAFIRRICGELSPSIDGRRFLQSGNASIQ